METMVKKSGSKIIQQNSLFYIKKNISLMNLIVLTLVLGGLFSSCGFLGLGGGNTFTEESTVNGNPGDGDTPTLSSRFEDNPELADESCKGNDRCEDVCDNIYQESDSKDTCESLTIGEVAKSEEVFYALVSGDPTKLEDIDEDDLKDFLDIGLDGWIVKVIDKQKSYEDADDRKARFSSTLKWIVDQENVVVSVLESKDRKSEVLKEVFLAYCHINDGGGCGKDSPATSGVHRRDGGQLYYNGLPVAYIEDEDDRYSLFEALRSAREDFFERAAVDRRYNAFGAGNKILEKVCTHTNDKSIDQCVRAFYCWLDGEKADINYQDRVFNQDEVIENIGRQITLNCLGLVDITL